MCEPKAVGAPFPKRRRNGWYNPLVGTTDLLAGTTDLRALRLALLAPIAWPTPPPGYGPWEQIASSIAEGMVARGLDVTLFATGNSRTRAKLASVVPVGLNEDLGLNGEVYTALHIAGLFKRAGEFDLIHNNFDWKPMTYALANAAPPLVTTIHGFSSPPILEAYYACAERSFFCSISDADRDDVETAEHILGRGCQRPDLVDLVEVGDDDVRLAADGLDLGRGPVFFFGPGRPLSDLGDNSHRTCAWLWPVFFLR